MNNLEAVLFVRKGDRFGGFSQRKMVLKNSSFDEKKIEDFIKNSCNGEIKIHFPKIIRGTATEGISWVLAELKNPYNWNTSWVCSSCGSRHPDLSNTLNKSQMELIGEKFPWTCPKCFDKRVKSI